jgi:nitrite reductase (NADH) small subunit
MSEAPDTRHRVCSVEKLPPGSSTIVTVGRHSIGVFNVDGEYFAFLNRCPHAGAPLCRGRVTGMAVARGPGFDVEWVRAGELLRCPWHAWEFELATGRSVSDPRIRAKTYAVHVEDGQVMVETSSHGRGHAG